MNNSIDNKYVKEPEITLKSILHVFLKKWIILLICISVCTGFAYVKTKKTEKPQYTNKTVVYVDAEKKDDYYNWDKEAEALELSNDRENVFDSYPLVIGSADYYNYLLKQNPDVFKNTTYEIEQIPDTRCFSITVKSDSADKVLKASEEVVKESKKYIDDKLNVNSVVNIWSAPNKNADVAPSQMKKNLVKGAGLGLIIYILYIFVTQVIHKRIDEKELLEKVFAEPIIGEITFHGKKKKNEMIGIESINTDSNLKMSYKRLKHNIEFSIPVTKNDKSKCIGVTGVGNSRIKSLNASQLAAVFGELPGKVLLIDADVKEPFVTTEFNLESREGITELITDNSLHESTICYSKEYCINILSAGEYSPQPYRIVSSEMFKQLIEKSKLNYDVIIVNFPNVKEIAETAVIADIVDGFVVSVLNKKTELDSLKKVLGVPVLYKEKFIGFVYNYNK